MYLLCIGLHKLEGINISIIPQKIPVEVQNLPGGEAKLPGGRGVQHPKTRQRRLAIGRMAEAKFSAGLGAGYCGFVFTNSENLRFLLKKKTNVKFLVYIEKCKTWDLYKEYLKILIFCPSICSL